MPGALDPDMTDQEDPSDTDDIESSSSSVVEASAFRLSQYLDVAPMNMIPSPLLSFMANAVKSYTHEQIKTATASSCSCSEVIEARDLLWVVSDNDVIPPLKKRKKINTKKGFNATIKDMTDAMAALDAASKVPPFGVPFELLQRVPQIGVSSNSMPNHVDERLARLEARIDSLEATTSPNYRTDMVDRKNLANQKRQNSKLYASVVEGPPHQEVSHDTAKMQVMNLRVPRVADTYPNGNFGMSHDAHVRVTDDDFIPAKGKKRRQRKAVVGTKHTSDAGSLKGAPEPSRDLFVYRVAKGTDASLIEKQFRSSSINIRSIEKRSKETAKFDSFRVEVLKSDVARVLKPDFWPEGIYVRRYFTPRKPKEDAEGNAEEDTVPKHF